MIQLYRLTMRFPSGIEALRDVSFRVHEGQLAFVVGRSGSGKSTLLALITAELKASDGQILVAGRNLSVLKADQRPLLRRTIGRLWQDPRLLPHLMLQDVRRDPWDFRYRLVGTTVREHSRADWTGRWMSEIPGQGEGSTVFRVVRWVSEAGAPAIFRPPYVGPHKEFKYCEAAVMPWTDDAGTIDRLMVAVDFLTA